MLSKVSAIRGRKQNVANIWSHSNNNDYDFNSTSLQQPSSYEKKEAKQKQATKSYSPVPVSIPTQTPVQVPGVSAGVGAGMTGGTTLSNVKLPVEKFLILLQNFQKQQKFLEEHFNDDDMLQSTNKEETYMIKDLMIKGKANKFINNNLQNNNNLLNLNLLNVEENLLFGCPFEISFIVNVLENISKKQKLILQKNNLLSKKIWTCCNLLENVERRIALKNCHVTYLNESNSLQNSLQNVDSTQQRVNCNISIVDNNIVMLCDTPGIYKVILNIEMIYSNLENLKNESSPKELSFYIPKSVTNQLEFIVPYEKCKVKITPSLQLEQVVVNNSTLQNTNLEKNLEEVKETKVTCQFPSTNYLSIEWTPELNQTKIDSFLQEHLMDDLLNTNHSNNEDNLLENDNLLDNKNGKNGLPLSLSSIQQSSCIIGEGMIQTKSKFDYTIVNGSITTLEISINTNGLPFRIISVNGIAIKQWDLISEEIDPLLENNNLTTTHNNNNELNEVLQEDELIDAQTLQQQKNNRKKLLITFIREIERNYTLDIISECDMGGTSAVCKVPSFSSLNVVRETGTLSIIAKTVIEIIEKSRKFLRKIDIAELPAYHRSHNYPVLLAYKFLEHDQHELMIEAIRHADIAVLSTNIEQLNYDITPSSDKLLHKLDITLYNTFKQYLRVTFDKEDEKAEIWSTTIDGQVVKPGQESNSNGNGGKTILIPLNKKQASKAININFVFTVPAKEMKKSGNIKFKLAKFDCPINQLRLSLHLPKGYKYGEFDGNILEVKSGLMSNTFISSAPLVSRFKKLDNYQAQQQVYREEQEQIDRAFDIGVNSVNLSQLDASTGQILFYFERFLLLEGEGIETQVDYKEEEKYFFQKRSLTGEWKRVFIYAFISLLIILFIYFKVFGVAKKQLL